MPLASRIKFAAVLWTCAAVPALAGTLRVHVGEPGGGAIADAVVALYGDDLPPLSGVAHAIMDQRDKRFVPHVLAVRQNTLVSFPNSDDIRHQVYSFSPAKRFELPLYHGTPAKPVLFDKAGEVALGCNIHDHMVGFIYVVDTPYFAKTGADGNAVIVNVVPGSYRARLWFPGIEADAAARETPVTVAGATSELVITAVVPPPPEPAPVSDLQRLFERGGDDR